MAGWFSAAADCASRRKRAWNEGSREVGAQQLDGHLPPEAGVATPVDLGHPAASQEVTDLVAVGEHARARLHQPSPPSPSLPRPLGSATSSVTVSPCIRPSVGASSLI